MPKGRRKPVKKAHKVTVKKPVKKAVKVKTKVLTKAQQKSFLLKALTDPKFRAKLEKTPAKALGVPKLSAQDIASVKDAMAKITEIENQISGLADMVLCAGGGPCGIA